MRHLLPSKEFFTRWESVGAKIVEPFQSFIALETAGGILLVVMTAVALVWANSGAAPLYQKLFHLKIGVLAGEGSFIRDVHFFVNEGLMTIFFLVIGLEIKRELLVGALTSARKAALPAVAALGGVVVPALIYYSINGDGPANRGWGIPMATDIAFVVGALAMLGSRVPQSLAVFLVSLAIVDDLCAVFVIAIFYSAEISFHSLGWASLALSVLLVFNLLGFRRPFLYVVPGLMVWFFVYKSGVHATVAGVLIALVVPARSKTDKFMFSDNMRKVFSDFKPRGERRFIYHLSEHNQGVVRAMERLCVSLEPPLQRLEYFLHPWVAFCIIPLFALANAGIKVEWSTLWTALGSREGLGIILGLFLGKQIGILGASWLGVKAGMVDLPENLSFSHVYAGSILCGIGFTMSLFIADLSFDGLHLLDRAKLAVLTGSIISAAVGIGVLYRVTESPK